jgi:hypothetical protein
MLSVKLHPASARLLLRPTMLKLVAVKRILFAGVALAFSCFQSFSQETYPGGIVYGPKAAFNISAPLGWVLDNNAGAEQGLPCVFYPKGSTWADAKTIMYAKIASTQYEDCRCVRCDRDQGDGKGAWQAEGKDRVRKDTRWHATLC